MSFEDYSNALKAGKSEYRSRCQSGHYPYLPILDEILSFEEVEYETSLGLCEVPLELIVGTKTAGRNKAFASNFMPLLSTHTEFAQKWIELCTSLQEEGLRDPIKAYEFMNRFYVLEGNKRVSVLKYNDAFSVPCIVTRVVPKRNKSKENKIYYEFLDFYNVTAVNYLFFSEEGRYARLLELTGTAEGAKWTKEEQIEFRSVFTRFKKAFEERGGKKLSITSGDALLAFLTVFGYEETKEKMAAEMKQDLAKIWGEFVALTEEQPMTLKMDPPKESQNLYKNILNFILPESDKPLAIAFFYEKTPNDSSWSYSHELGRLHLESVFGDQILTTAYENVLPGENDEALMEEAIAAGYTLLFTTSPPMIPSSLKVAATHPEIYVLNCSLNTSHPTMRTYYARMYEAKFLAGIIAGIMSPSDKIGYLADYPIFGMTANINAFALGAKMVNPNARIHLDWTRLRNRTHKVTEDPEISYIIDQDMVTPGNATRHFGLYRKNGHTPENIAMTTWHWGKLYERIVRNVLSGTWKAESSGTKAQAINYWWGMSAGVIDLITSQNLPSGVKRLVDLLKSNICAGEFIPFSGELYDQNHTLVNEAGQDIPPEEIMTMDWLLDNVVGSIPSLSELNVEAQVITRMKGLETTQEK